MTLFVAYLLKSSASLAFLFVLYKLILARENLHRLNRFLLLGILFLSALIPLVRLPGFDRSVVSQPVVFVREVFIPEISSVGFSASMPVEADTVPFASDGMQINVLHVFYWFVILFLLFRLMLGLFQIVRLYKKSQRISLTDFVLAVVNDIIQPFSFLKHIFISEKDYELNREILIAHEAEHIKQRHYIDLLLVEMFSLLHWFNPFMWLLRRDLKLIHEYQADQAVLKKGIDAQKYQLLVLEKAVGERRFAMASNFVQKPILKRIKMMKKKKVNRWKGVRLIVFIPLVALLLQAFDRPEKVIRKLDMKLPEIVKSTEKVLSSTKVLQNQKELTGFVIEVKDDGNYIDGKSQSLEELVNKAKAWQTTGREDILLELNGVVSSRRIDEIRQALSKAKVYHINQTTINSEEIIYPAGDVSRMPQMKDGEWNSWMHNQLSIYLKDIPKDWEYNIFYGFIIDKNGKVRDAHIIEESQYPEVNEAYDKILSQIPDWKPAQKGNTEVSVLYTEMSGQRKK